MYAILVSHSIKKIKSNKYILLFINGAKIELNLKELIKFISFDGVVYKKNIFLDKLIKNNLVILNNSSIKTYNRKYILNLMTIDSLDYFNLKYINISSISILLFKNCNLNCPFCYLENKNNINLNELDLEFLDSFISDNIFFGLNKITILGGEISLLPKIKINALNKIMSKYNFIHFEVITNGFNINKLVNLPFQKFNFSIDGTKEIHNKFRKNNFDIVINSLKKIIKLNKLYNINHIVNKENIDDLPYFLNFCFDNNFININLNNEQQIYCSNLNIFDNQRINLCASYYNKKLRLVHFTFSKDKPSLYNCQNGFNSYYYIYPEKKQLFCSYYSKIDLGYVSQNPFNLLNNTYINKYKSLNTVKNKCVKCCFFKFCKTNCLLYKKNECDKNMYIYNVEKISIKKIKSDFINFFPFILKHKSFEKIVKEYNYIAYAKNKYGKVISCVLFKEYLEFPYVWQLGRISTDSKFLGKGIASNLLKIICDFIISKKGKKILVYVSNENKIAQRFYNKNDFKKEAKISKMKLGIDDLYIFSKDV